MNRTGFSVCGVFAALLFLSCFVFPSCERAGKGGALENGELRLRFSDDIYEYTKASAELPDTNDFILDIRDSKGKVIYSGFYGDSPESLSVSPGSYSVSVKSSEFDKPRFSMPQYGDEQCVVVPSDGIINVILECRQINAGIRLKVDSGFLTSYPEGVLYVSSDQGRLMYGYSEKRIAYFNPGSVSVVLSEGGTEKTLLTRTLRSQEILTIGIYVASGSSPDRPLSIKIDTTRIWNEESFTIGGGDGNKGDGYDNALTITQAKASIGEKDVWVRGYIVGGDLSASAISFRPPFSSATNLAISSRSSATSKEQCMSVQLPAGEIREALNLVDHSELVGRQLYINGDIVEAYFGIPGIKNVSDFVLK